MVSHDHTLLGNLVLTDAGVATLHEADHIFALGELLPQRVREAASGPTLRLNLGISDGIAKLAVHRLLTPALDEPHRRLLCHEGEFQPLLSELALPAGVLADTTDRRRLVSGALLAQTVAGALLILLVGLSLVVWALSLAGRSTHATAPLAPQRRVRQFHRRVPPEFGIIKGMKTLLLKPALMVSLLAVLAGCGSSPVYKKEDFKKETPFQRAVDDSPVKACDAAQMALLSQGYRIEASDGVSIHAQKHFQPEDEVNTTIDFFVTCKDHDGGSMVFANAVETTYKLKKTSSATGLSVAGAGSITMPWSKSADSLVKVADQTIADGKFYQRFFDLLSTYLGGKAR